MRKMLERVTEDSAGRAQGQGIEHLIHHATLGDVDVTFIKPFGLMLLFSAFCLAQTDDYAPEKENVLLKTRAGKQLFKEDVQCGNYFWISVKAAVNGAPVDRKSVV